jgi:hypothetical protein
VEPGDLGRAPTLEHHGVDHAAGNQSSRPSIGMLQAAIDCSTPVGRQTDVLFQRRLHQRPGRSRASPLTGRRADSRNHEACPDAMTGCALGSRVRPIEGWPRRLPVSRGIRSAR